MKNKIIEKELMKIFKTVSSNIEEYLTKVFKETLENEEPEIVEKFTEEVVERIFFIIAWQHQKLEKWFDNGGEENEN